MKNKNAGRGTSGTGNWQNWVCERVGGAVERAMGEYEQHFGEGSEGLP